MSILQEQIQTNWQGIVSFVIIWLLPLAVSFGMIFLGYRIAKKGQNNDFKIEINRASLVQLVRQGYFAIDVDFSLKIKNVPSQIARLEYCIRNKRVNAVNLSFPLKINNKVESFLARFEIPYDWYLSGSLKNEDLVRFSD